MSAIFDNSLPTVPIWSTIPVVKRNFTLRIMSYTLRYKRIGSLAGVKLWNPYCSTIGIAC